jgi:IS5 family transposase
MILTCEVAKGNPSDSALYKPTIEKVKEACKAVPKSSAADGGFASKDNPRWARGQGIVNVVFNKLTGSLKSASANGRLEKKLKRWRSGMEAVISNLKRGFNIRRRAWKGWEHFKQKIFWSVIAYNIRLMTGCLLLKMQTL